MKVVCESCGTECEIEVKGPTLLRRALPKGWRPRLIDGKTYVLCDVCGNLRQFVGGLSPYLATRLNLPPNVAIEFPEYTEFPDARRGRSKTDKNTENENTGTSAKRIGRMEGKSMTDINKIIAAGDMGGDPDREARAVELKSWNKDTAVANARAEGIQLTDSHMAVIQALQDDYVENGRDRHAREIADMLDERFATQGGRKYLYELFPGGPVSQGGRLAGIPVPADSKDASFGSVL